MIDKNARTDKIGSEKKAAKQLKKLLIQEHKIMRFSAKQFLKQLKEAPHFFYLLLYQQVG